MVSFRELERYAESLVNSNNDEASTYSRNVYTKIENNKIYVVFNSPTSFKLNEELYYKIYFIIIKINFIFKIKKSMGNRLCLN